MERGHQLHPPGDADDRCQAPAGGAPQYVGFLYYVSITGITGAAAPVAADVHAQVARIKKATKLPVAVGFGVRTPEQAREIGRGADGVVVGSALVNAIKDTLGKQRTSHAAKRLRPSGSGEKPRQGVAQPLDAGHML